jgi:peptide/nickel transport system substrate-binding protein
MAAAGGGVILAACTGNGDGQDGDGGSPADAPTVPPDLTDVIYGDLYADLPYGGSLEMGQTQLADTLNILVNTLGAISWQADPAHDFLERYDHRGDLVPSLAESMEVVDDITLRYVLREARFHNGRAVMSEDVRETISWVQDPDNGSARATAFEGVTVEVEDERTVILKLPQPDAGFRHHLPRLPIIPIEEVDSQAEKPIGCGPFIFREWVRDSHVEYERNEEYWNPAAPRLDTLRIRTLSDTQAAASSFLAGDLDFVEGIPVGLGEDFRARADSGEFKVDTFFPGWVFVAFQNERDPFANPLVKRAMSLAVDRAAVAQAFGGSLGSQPISTGPLAPSHPWFPADLEMARDTDGAQQLLRDAGFPNGFSDVVLRAEEYAGTPDAAVVLQANWADVGIDVEIEVTDSATYVERREAGNFDMYLSGWFVTPEPAFVLDGMFTTGASSNYWKYSNRELDQLLAEAKTILDDDDRRSDLYHRAMEIAFLEDPGMIALCTEANLFAYRNSTNGDQYRPDPGPLFHYPIAATSA